GRARETGAREPRSGGSGDCGKVRRSLRHLCRTSGGAATSSNEYHLRDHEGAGNDDPDSELDGRYPEPFHDAGPRVCEQSRAGSPRRPTAQDRGAVMKRAIGDVAPKLTLRGRKRAIRAILEARFSVGAFE